MGGMTTWDIRILGAGVFGLSVAWAAVQRGARVQVVDPFGVASGASGGIVGALQPHVPENWNDKKAFQLKSLLMAEGWWQGIEDRSGTSAGYGRYGRIQPLPHAAAVELAQKRIETAAELWGDAARWAVTDAPGDFAPHSPTGLYVHDTLSAKIIPSAACQSLAAAIGNSGGAVVTDPSGSAGAEVWATGAAGLADLSRILGRPMGGSVKGQAALLEMSVPEETPQVFADGIHIVPRGAGLVAIGSTSERDQTDLACDEALEEVIAKARQVMPALAKAPVHQRWAGLRPRAKSRAPMLGPLPDSPGVYIANGGFKIGFGMAPLVGETLARLILDGVDEIPPDFRVEANFRSIRRYFDLASMTSAPVSLRAKTPPGVQQSVAAVPQIRGDRARKLKDVSGPCCRSARPAKDRAISGPCTISPS